MKNQLATLSVPLLITLFILVIVEIISSSFLPLLGLYNFKIAIHILITLFFAFKLGTIYVPILVFIIQYFHSFFSIEGWEVGTVAGVIICILTNFLKDVVHLTSVPLTILFVQIFQVVWLLIICGLLYFKGVDTEFLTLKLWRFIPESIFISAVAPFFFNLLENFWKVDDKSSLEQGF